MSSVVAKKAKREDVQAKPNDIVTEIEEVRYWVALADRVLKTPPPPKPKASKRAA